MTDEETDCFAKGRKAILLREKIQVKLYSGSDCPGGSVRHWWVGGGGPALEPCPCLV